MIQVCHFPPGTSKSNKIEHRMVCHITNNWRGRPFVSREVEVNLIGSTTTDSGLRIDTFHRESGGVVVDADAHPALICGDIVDAIGRHLAELRADYVMDANLFGIALWPPFPPPFSKSPISSFFLLSAPPVLPIRHKSSSATSRWPSPPCSRASVGCCDPG